MAFASRSPGVDVVHMDYGGYGGKGIHGGSWGKAAVFFKPGLGDKLTKADADMLPAVEWIASRLAIAVGLPTPTGQIGTYAGKKVWVSLAVKLNSEDVAPPDPATVVAAEPSASAGAFVFDTWIFNNDRHDENILYHKDLGLWLIDHDQALSGPTMSDTLGGLPAFEKTPITRHVFRGIVADRHVEQWITRIRHFPVSVVKGIIDTGHRAGIYPKTYGEGIARFLTARSTNLAELVAKSQGTAPVSPKPSAADTELTLDGGGAS